jgi:hypothetical protein
MEHFVHRRTNEASWNDDTARGVLQGAGACRTDKLVASRVARRFSEVVIRERFVT